MNSLVKVDYNCLTGGLLGLLAAVLPEIGVFPIIVHALAVEVMSVEVILGFVVEKNVLISIRRCSRFPSTGQLYLLK